MATATANQGLQYQVGQPGYVPPTPYQSQPKTEEEYFSELNDPNQYDPLYGGTAQMGSDRYGQLQDLSQFVGSFDPNADPNDAYTPDVMKAYQDQLAGYVGAQGAFNQATNAQADFDAANKSYQDLPNQISALDKQIKDAGPLGLNLSGIGSGSILGVSENLKQLKAQKDSLQSQYDALPGTLAQKQKALDDARNSAIQNFVVPQGNYALQREKLSKQLNGIESSQLADTSKNIYAQGWIAKQDTAELMNRMGQFRSGAREQTKKDINNRAIGSYANAVGQAESSKAQGLSKFDQATADAKTRASDLQQQAQRGGYGTLTDSSFQQNVDDSARQSSLASEDSYNQAVSDLQKQKQEGDVFGDILGKVGAGVGAVIGALV